MSASSLASTDHSPSQLFQRACTLFDYASELFDNAAVAIADAHLLVAYEEKEIKTIARPSTNSLRLYAKSEQQTAASVAKKGKRKVKALHDGATLSPYFPQPLETNSRTIAKKLRQKRQVLHDGATISPYFPQPDEPFSRIPAPPGLSFELQPSQSTCHLIQERICGDLFALVVQAILWNKTKGSSARPVLWKFLFRYPTAQALAAARVEDVERLIGVLGLQKERSKRLVNMAMVWVASPPSPERRYQRRDYPKHGDGRETRKGEILRLDDPREGWEIAHLPGIGAYGLDSYRIFGRDRLRGVHDQPDIEPEWKRLTPGDKELRPYVKWKWSQEGWDYDVKTGDRVRSQPDRQNPQTDLGSRRGRHDH